MRVFKRNRTPSRTVGLGRELEVIQHPSPQIRHIAPGVVRLYADRGSSDHACAYRVYVDLTEAELIDAFKALGKEWRLASD